MMILVNSCCLSSNELLLRRHQVEKHIQVIFLYSFKILERAAKLMKLLVRQFDCFTNVETQAGELVVIFYKYNSITDGQIFQKKNYFKRYQTAVNVGLSVSRVGSAANCSNEKSAGSLKLEQHYIVKLLFFSLNLMLI